MIMKKSLLTATVASGLIIPTAEAGLYVPPKPAIIKPENVEFSKHLLKAMPMTLGLMIPKVSATFPTVEFTFINNSTSNATSYNFNGCDIGTASSDRLVVAVMTNWAGSTARTLASCSIGGVAATVAATGSHSSTNSSSWGVAYILFTTGTSTSISFSLSGQANNCVISVFTVKGYQSATPTVYSDTSGGLTIALGNHPYGAGLGAATHADTDRSVNVTSSGSTQPVIEATNNHGTESGRTAAYTLADASGSPSVFVGLGGSSNTHAGFMAVWQ